MLDASGEVIVTVPPDTGCHLHSSCLACPRPVCILDEAALAGKRSVVAARAATRRQQMRADYDAGATLAELVQRYGLGRRTVQRDLAATAERGSRGAA